MAAVVAAAAPSFAAAHQVFLLDGVEHSHTPVGTPPRSPRRSSRERPFDRTRTSIAQRSIESGVLRRSASLRSDRSHSLETPLIEPPIPDSVQFEVPGRRSCRQSVWHFLNCNSIRVDSGDLHALERLDTLYEIASIVLVIVVVLLDILGSVEELQEWVAQFDPLQIFAGCVFTVEYTLRLWSCVESPEFEGWLFGRLKWACKFLALADFAVVFAFLVGQFAGFGGKGGVQALRMVRLLRLFALFKMDRRSSAFSIIFHVFERKWGELLAAFATALVLMVMSATIMYYIENDAQPDKFSSVPAAMWWSTAALTTVGYGDISPVTALGQMFGGIVAIFGIALFALPAGILGSAYVEVMEDEDCGLFRGMTGSNGLDLEEEEIVESSVEAAPAQPTTKEVLSALSESVGHMMKAIEALQEGQQELQAKQELILAILDGEGSAALAQFRSRKEASI